MRYYSVFLFDINNKKESTIIIGRDKTKTKYDYNTIVFENNETTIKITESNENESIITLKTIVSEIDKLTDEMLFSYYFFSLIQISIFSIDNIKKIISDILTNKNTRIQEYVKSLKIDKNILTKFKIGYIYTDEYLNEIFTLSKILYIEQKLNPRQEIIAMQLQR